MRQKRPFICLLLCIALLFSSCQMDRKKKGGTAEKTAYRDNFTEEEKINGAAKFDLMENLTVDAQITFADKYRNGLKKYYMEHFLEPDTLNSRIDFEKKPTLFGRSLSKSMDMIAEQVDGTFSDKKAEWDDTSADLLLRTTFDGGNGKNYSFTACWGMGDEAFDSHNKAYSPIVHMKLPEGANSGMDINLMENIKEYVKDYNDMEISFIKDKKKTGEELKKFLEKLVGRKISDTWECVPITTQSVAALNKVFKSSISGLKPEEEYCTYWYYYDVKGFPFVDSNLNYTLKEGDTASELARRTSPNNTLMGLSDLPLLCYVSKDGIIGLDIYNIRMEGDVYKDTESVIEPDVVLKKIKKYYEKQILAKPVTVLDIKIVYTGYFTDSSEGEIQPMIAPFWRVRVHDGERNVYFVYDAFTGEAVAQNNPTS